MARRSTLYRCHLFSFGGPQTEGVVSQWTKNLVPIRERTVFSGEIVELYVTIQASIHPVTEDARVRFDILEQDHLFTGGLDDRIVSFLGTGVDQAEEGFTPQDKSTVFHRLTDGQSIQSYIEQYKQNQSDYQDHILVIEEPPHEGSLYHILAWWAAQRLADLLNSEFYFIINVNDVFEDQSEEIIHVSPTVNMPMTLSWEEGNRTFTLTTRFRSTDIHLDFRGEIIISRTYGPDYNRYSRLTQFSLDSRQEQDRFTVSQITEDTIEIRQPLQVSDIDRGEPERYITSYPFLLNSQRELMRLNRTNEPRYAFKVQLARGDEGFGAEQVNTVIRAFENIFMEADRLPELSGHPAEDDESARSYRQRMVEIPDVIVEELRNQILAANNESESERNTDFLWWGVPSWIEDYNRRNPYRPPYQLIAVPRIIKSRQQIEQKINQFVASATSDRDISDFINHHFNLEEINLHLRIIGENMGEEHLNLFSTNSGDREITLRIEGSTRLEERVEESIILEGITEVQTRHQYLNIVSIEVEQGTLEGVLKVRSRIADRTFRININERKIRYDNLREFNGFLIHGGCRLSVDSMENSDSDISKTIIILGYRDEHLRNQVTEEIPIGSTGNITFYKIHHIYFGNNFDGIISIRATRDGTHKILWRNIFDEDIPEEVIQAEIIEGPLYVFVERRAQYLQKLGNIFREYLGIDKNIWIFLSNVSLERDRLGSVIAVDNDYRYCINLNIAHSVFFGFSDLINAFVHECKHVHQNDRIKKLPHQEQNVEFNAWQSGDDTWDMRLVKAWKLNEEGNFPSSRDPRGHENYEGQIIEVDAREFADRVITREWVDTLSRIRIGID